MTVGNENLLSCIKENENFNINFPNYMPISLRYKSSGANRKSVSEIDKLFKLLIPVSCEADRAVCGGRWHFAADRADGVSSAGDPHRSPGLC